MSPSLRIPRNATGARVVLVGCLAVPAVGAALTNLFAGPIWIPIAVYVVALVAVSQLLLTQDEWRAASLGVKAVVMAAFLTAALWMIAMMYAPRLTVLAVRGEQVVAHVVAHDVSRYPSRSGGYDEHCYTLRRVDGASIFGTICRDRDGEFVVGQSVDVLVDPSGLIAPETADEVAFVRFWQVLGLASLAATLTLCWIGGGLIVRSPSPSRRRGRHSY